MAGVTRLYLPYRIRQARTFWIEKRHSIVNILWTKHFIILLSGPRSIVLPVAYIYRVDLFLCLFHLIDMVAPSMAASSMDAPSMAATLPVVTVADGASNSALKSKRMNYQNWEVVALVFGCHVACVSKPQSTVLYRSTFLRNHYKKYAEQCLSMYGLTRVF